MRLNELKRKHNAMQTAGQELYAKMIAMGDELIAIRKEIEEIEGDDYDGLPLIFGAGYWIGDDQEETPNVEVTGGEAVRLTAGLERGELRSAALEPAGFVTRQHENGKLVKDGGRIVSIAVLIDETIVSGNLYSEAQLHMAVKAEREVCARIAERWGETHDAATTVNARNAGGKIGRAIRKRSNV